MRRFIKDFKMKNIAFFLLFFLLVSGHSNANAVGGSIGGWRITSNVAQGIGAKITATKDVIVNGASKAVTSSATVLPKAANVGKFMGKNFGAAAVIGAVDLLLDGVDYVMDPVNNSVNYYTAPDSTTVQNYHQYRWGGYVGSTLYYKPSGESFVSSWTEYYKTADPNVVNIVSVSCSISGIVCSQYNAVRENGTTITLRSIREPNPSYNPAVENPRKPVSVPLSTVASQVLDQAEKDIKAGNPTAPAVVLSRAVAQDMIQEAEADDVKARPIAQQLEKNPEYPSDNDAEGEITKPEVIDPATGEVVKPAETSSIAMQFPKACEWFPQACVFIDWAMTDPNVDSDMEVPEKEIEKQDIKKDLVKISGRSCPADVKFDVDGLPFGIKINKAYSMQEICNTVEPLKYVFELITAVICALILLRV